MKRKFVLPFVLALAGACNQQPGAKQPQPLVVEVLDVAKPEVSVEDSSNETPIPQNTAPIYQVSEAIRQRIDIHCSNLHWPLRSKGVSFYIKMWENLSPTEQAQCEIHGESYEEYDVNCITNNYKRIYGEDELYRNFKKKEEKYKKKMETCMEKTIEECIGAFNTRCIEEANF